MARVQSEWTGHAHAVGLLGFGWALLTFIFIRGVNVQLVKGLVAGVKPGLGVRVRVHGGGGAVMVVARRVGSLKGDAQAQVDSGASCLLGGESACCCEAR